MSQNSAAIESGNLRPNDVLLGRGGATNNHEGNKRYRTIVQDHQSEYLNSRKKSKVSIAQKIVMKVYSNGGRFLKREASGIWAEVPFKRATEKTSQALREGLDVRNQKIREQKQVRRFETGDEVADRTNNVPANGHHQLLLQQQQLPATTILSQSSTPGSLNLSSLGSLSQLNTAAAQINAAALIHQQQQQQQQQLLNQLNLAKLSQSPAMESLLQQHVSSFNPSTSTIAQLQAGLQPPQPSSLLLSALQQQQHGGIAAASGLAALSGRPSALRSTGLPVVASSLGPGGTSMATSILPLSIASRDNSERSAASITAQQQQKEISIQ